MTLTRHSGRYLKNTSVKHEKLDKNSLVTDKTNSKDYASVAVLLELYHKTGVVLLTQNQSLINTTINADFPNFVAKNKQRFLLTGQTTGSQNGYYYFNDPNNDGTGDLEFV